MKRKWTPEEVQQWYAETRNITYANREDGNWVVRKPKSLGWTLNWSNPVVWLMEAVFAIVMLVFLAMYA